MKMSSITVSSQTASPWFPVDWRNGDFKIGFAVIVSGTLTYDVEHTYENVFDSTVTPTAFNHPTVNGETTSQEGTYDTPVTAIRLNVTAYTTGSATLHFVQAG